MYNPRNTSLSPEAIQIVQSTAPLVAEHCHQIVNIFYPTLFTMFPSVKGLFNMAHQDVDPTQKIGAQRKALADALIEYALNIENLGALGTLVDRIANKHCSLGIAPYQYLFVGSALLHAFKEVLAEKCTPIILDSWAQAYWCLANILIEREFQIYNSVSTKPRGWSVFITFVVQKNS